MQESLCGQRARELELLHCLWVLPDHGHPARRVQARSRRPGVLSVNENVVMSCSEARARLGSEQGGEASRGVGWVHVGPGSAGHG